MNISEIMTRNVVTVKPGLDVQALAKIFIEKDISGAPVLDDADRFLGIVLEEGLVFQDKKIHLPTFIYFFTGFLTFGEERFEEEMKRMAATTVEGIMERTPVVIAPDTPVEDVATLIVEKGIHYFPVLEGGKLVGVVTRKDIVRGISEKKIW